MGSRERADSREHNMSDLLVWIWWELRRAIRYED